MFVRLASYMINEIWRNHYLVNCANKKSDWWLWSIGSRWFLQLASYITQVILLSLYIARAP